MDLLIAVTQVRNGEEKWADTFQLMKLQSLIPITKTAWKVPQNHPTVHLRYTLHWLINLHILHFCNRQCLPLESAGLLHSAYILCVINCPYLMLNLIRSVVEVTQKVVLKTQKLQISFLSFCNTFIVYIVKYSIQQITIVCW